jgi:hypothetical protein
MRGSVRAVALTPVAYIPPTLMAAYGFSEGTGTTTADNSGNGHTMTLNTVSWATGHTGYGLTNIASSLGAKATITAPANTVTIMGWVKPLDLTSGSTHAAFGFMDNGGNSDVVIFTQRGDFGTSNILQGDIRLGGTLTPIYGPTLRVDVWTHLALTYDGAQIKLYKDGSLVSTVTAAGVVAPGDAFYAAGWSASPYENANVTVDDLRVFTNALPASEITAAMNKPVSQ